MWFAWSRRKAGDAGRRGVAGRLAGERGGSIAIMTALTMIPTLAVVGLAVDTSHFFSTRFDIQNALDLAVLAAARESQRGQTEPDAKSVFTQSFNANIPDLSSVTIIPSSPTFSEDSGLAVKTISSTAQVSYAPLMLNLVGVQQIEYQLTSTSSYSIIQDLEIVFAIDFSSSMAAQPGSDSFSRNSPGCQSDFVSDFAKNCERKIDLAIDAITNTVMAIKNNITDSNVNIGLVPFQNGIRLPRNLFYIATGRSDQADATRPLARLVRLSDAYTYWNRYQSWSWTDSRIIPQRLNPPDVGEFYTEPSLILPHYNSRLSAEHEVGSSGRIEQFSSSCEYASDPVFAPKAMCRADAPNDQAHPISYKIECVYYECDASAAHCSGTQCGDDAICSPGTAPCGDDAICDTGCKSTCDSGYVLSTVYCTTQSLCVTGRRSDLSNAVPGVWYEDRSVTCLSPPILPLFDKSSPRIDAAINGWLVNEVYTADRGGNAVAALLWAWNILSPDWEANIKQYHDVDHDWSGSAVIKPFTGANAARKIVIMIVSGHSFTQASEANVVPKEIPDLERDHPGVRILTEAQMLVSGAGSISSNSNVRAHEICRGMHASDIEVFVVFFNTGDVEKQILARRFLGPCTSGDRYLFLAENGPELNTALSAILQYIQSVRLNG